MEEKNSKNVNKKKKPVDAVELAILNGIENYNREQEKKKNLGQERSKEAMADAGYVRRRTSRAKGKGTKILPAPAADKTNGAKNGAKTPAADARKAQLQSASSEKNTTGKVSKKKRKCSFSAASGRSARI